MKLNKAWHVEHVMPKNPSLAQRVEWHKEHVVHCACRPIPEKIMQILAEQKVGLPKE